MAGSKRAFNYILDNGLQIAVVLDESNIEEVNAGGLAAPSVGAIIFPVASKLRYALYSNADGSITRKIPVLSLANLATIPPVLTTFVGPGSGAGGGTTAVQLGLSTTRGEQFQRYRGGDSGLNDGDIP